MNRSQARIPFAPGAVLVMGFGLMALGAQITGSSVEMATVGWGLATLLIGVFLVISGVILSIR